jgi:hypothetical protein
MIRAGRDRCKGAIAINPTCCRASSRTNRRHTSSCSRNSCSSPSDASFVELSPLILSRCATETARS